jgi:hypothetical protein
MAQSRFLEAALTFFCCCRASITPVLEAYRRAITVIIPFLPRYGRKGTPSNDGKRFQMAYFLANLSAVRRWPLSSRCSNSSR